MMDVSIVLSCYNRPKQLRRTLESIRVQDGDPEIIVVEDGDDGLTRHAAREFGAKYFQKDRSDLPAFQNPSRVHNIGIRQATRKVVVLQGGEVMYVTRPNALTLLTDPVLANPKVATTPLVQSVDKGGEFFEWLVTPNWNDSKRAGWIINFCLAVDRGALLKIGGFEEAYTGYGGEDDQLMYSLREIGVVPQYVPEVLANHQWHDRSRYQFDTSDSAERLATFIHQVEHEGRPPVANIGRNWGRI
jgi:GT2 family glycosyltransferase